MLISVLKAVLLCAKSALKATFPPIRDVGGEESHMSFPTLLLSAWLCLFLSVRFFYAPLSSLGLMHRHTPAVNSVEAAEPHTCHLLSSYGVVPPLRLSLCHPGGRLRDAQSHALRKTVNEQNFTVW